MASNCRLRGGEADALARLQAQQASLHPFELNGRIEEKLGAIYERCIGGCVPLGLRSRARPQLTTTTEWRELRM